MALKNVLRIFIKQRLSLYLVSINIMQYLNIFVMPSLFIQPDSKNWNTEKNMVKGTENLIYQINNQRYET